MKYVHFWMMCASAGATAMIVAGAATPVQAQPGQVTTVVGERAVDDDLRRVQVSYRDLNLAAARDEQRLYYRVKGAAGSVCAPNDDQHVYRPFSKCVGFAMNGALPQIDLAVKRAREIASTGTSSIPLVAIAVVGVR